MDLKKSIKEEYCTYIGDDRKPVPALKLPNSLYQKIKKHWENKNLFDEELFNDGLLLSHKITWTKDYAFNLYKNLCIENGGPIYNLKIYSSLTAYIIKFFGTKYDLEKLLGYHNFDDIEPIVTTYEEIPELENPKYLMKRFGDYEKGYTGEEEILVRELQVYQKNFKKIKELSEPELMKIKDLSEDKRMFYGVKINNKSERYIYKGSISRDKGSRGGEILKKTIDVDDPKLWWLVGRWLGDGWTREYIRLERNNSKQLWVYLCCGKHELSELTDFFDDFQVKAGYHEERTVYKFKITKHEWFYFFSQFGKGAKGKFIPEVVKNLPIHLLKELLDGYFTADGYYNPKKNAWSASSVGKKLIRDLVECIEKVYEMPVTLSKNKFRPTSVIEGRTVNNSQSYTIVFKKDKRLQDKCFYENGYLWYPISCVKNIEEVLDYSDEIWLPIEWTNNQFSVSNFGRIKSHKNKDKITKISYRIGQKRTIKRAYDKAGRVRFSLDKSNLEYRVNELVWEAFGSSKKEDNMEIIFIDGDEKNCHIDNLKSKIKCLDTTDVIFDEAPMKLSVKLSTCYSDEISEHRITTFISNGSKISINLVSPYKEVEYPRRSSLIRRIRRDLKTLHQQEEEKLMKLN